MNLQSDVASGNTITLSADEIKKKQKIYWTDETEAAVKEFLSLDLIHLQSKYNAYLKRQAESGTHDPTIDDGYAAEMLANIRKSTSEKTKMRKEDIFRNKIRTPLNRLIENIIFSFKLFRYDIDVKTLHNDCMSHVYEKFHKFDPDQNTKSFSYFGTIAKHYLQNRKKDLDTMKSINLNYDEHVEEVDSRGGDEDGAPQASDEIMDLFHHMIAAFEKNMTNKALNDNDRKVLDSILELFKSHGHIDEEPFEDDPDLSDPKEHKGRILTATWKRTHGAGDVLDDNKYSKGNIFDFIMDRSKLTKEEMSKSLTKLRNLYKEKRKDFYNKIGTDRKKIN